MSGRLAIMQPYFMPYAGYYRLAAAADTFVIYDCVQFPRRGWVHRNRLPLADGRLDWLTLPIAKAPQDVLIQDLRFADDADTRLREQCRRFPVLAGVEPSWLGEALFAPRGSVVDYLERQLAAVLDHLGLHRPLIRSSTLGLDPALRAQDRILEIARRLGATTYVNAPGGRELYDADAFAAAGIRLRFLPEHAGPKDSLLARLPREPAEALRAEILANLGGCADNTSRAGTA